MFLRALFVLLLVLNLGAGAWLLFGSAPEPPPVPATDPGVPMLELLAERGNAANDADLAAAPETAAELADDVCRTLGPFPTQADVHGAMTALAPLVKRMRMREVRTSEARGYWVYLPAVASRERALATARELSRKGVRDYYVVTAGEQQNTISLGLFRDPANAERRSAELVALGFLPRTGVRTEDMPAYWLDYTLAADAGLDWRQVLPAAADLREEPVACR